MEEAASLFGPADSASDLFGNIATNGGDDLAGSLTSPPSELPLSNAREADAGSNWYDGASSHYQAETSLHPEYDRRSSDDTSHYSDNFQPQYKGSTPSNFTDSQPINPYTGDNLQHTASHDVGHIDGTYQNYEPNAGRPPFERSSTLQLSDGSLGDHTSYALQARAAHVQSATSDSYRPASQPPSNSSSSSMYPKPPLSSPYDPTASFSSYQPVANDSHSVPQSGYQPYSARPSSQVAHMPIGTESKPSNPPTTALYRPRTTNAYDPPIPPPKPSRHVSRALGSSRAFPPTGATQTYAAQDMRHATYHANPRETLPPNSYTHQAHVPTPPIVPHLPSNAPLATSVSPPHRESQSRIVPRPSIPAESSVSHSYPVWPQHVASTAENIPFDQLGHPAIVSRENDVLTSNQVVDHQFQPGQRGELLARPHGQDISSSGNQYNYADTGSGFTRQPTTSSSYSTEVARSLPAPIHTTGHDVPSYAPILDRVHSPGNSSVRSSRSARSRDLASPPPAGVASGSTSHAPITAEPSTESGPVVSRVSSPGSIRSWKSPHPPSYDPYAPASNTEPYSLMARDRSMSNSSLVSSRSSTTSDRYIPSRHGPHPSEVPASASLHQTSRVPAHDTDRSHSQTLILPPQTHTPYAPSPSLLGTNDPLGRTSSSAPVVSFGFGGKLVLCFHGSNTLNTGFDIALSSRQTTGIQIRPLHAAIPESALDHASTSFPGPLFCDPGSPTGLVRAAVATQSKNNKAKVIEYLEGRAEEITRGLGYLSQGSPERRQAEGKLTLVKLLRVLLEHDGKLSGSSQVEAAVRAVLVPRLGDAPVLEQSTSPKTAPYGLDGATASSLTLSALNPHDRVLSVQSVKASALDKIQDLLTQGERIAAYRYALDERLWAHAMIIASSIDKDAWKEVTNEFIRSELNSQGVVDATGSGRRDTITPGTGREPLKVAYSLYSGQGAASIQALVPPTSLIQMGEKFQPPALSHITPISPNFTSPLPVPVDVLDKWPDTAAMLIPGPSVSECSSTLLALGDCLLANHSVEAAHACYLLAPQSPVLGRIGTPGRVTLVGSRGPTSTPNFHVNDDAIVFSEIVEFAHSLAPPSKGQEPFNGLPHLQAYKFVRAASLAEMGHMLAASRYCEAIATCLNRTHALPHPELSEQLREFTDRLIGAPDLDKTGSWIRGKMTRPSLDSLGNWLGGRLTEFVAGGDDSPTPNGDTTPHESKTFGGPFSHYSTITSSTTSKAPSPQPTTVNHYALSDAQSKLPRRTGSAQAVRLNPQVQIDRASSAMEYRPIHRNSSPTPRIASASAATTHFAQASSNYSGYPLTNSTNGPYQLLENEASDGDSRGGAWWDSSNTEDSSSTPVVTMFPNDRSSPPSSFMSLMDVPPIPAIPASSVPTRSPSLATYGEDEGDDDLGLGNSYSKRKASTNDSGTTVSSVPDSKTAETDTRPQAESKPTQQSSSWLSRWWNKEGSRGPVKATLGEESSFVYDKELKRWVNKKSGAEATQPTAPPPPPSRAQTTSPSRSTQRIPNGMSLAPPPTRAASAIDLSASPPRRMVPRPRSALAPGGDELANGVHPPAPRLTDSPSPAPSGSPTPPPSRPRSQAAKRNIRSRYVDVFQPSAET